MEAKPNTTRVSRVSILTGNLNVRDLPIDPVAFAIQLRKWTEREILIQEAFPYLSKGDREFIMSGITPEEWNATFGEEE
jgi:hypothetical protein